VRDENILPGTGRWRAEGVTEGALLWIQRLPTAPSTMLRMVPLTTSGEEL
jgi:hypothetical protein